MKRPSSLSYLYRFARTSDRQISRSALPTRPEGGSKTWLVGSVWFATLAVIIASSVVMDAKLSTSAYLLMIGIAPAIVTLLIGADALAPTVAEALHSVHARDGR